MSNSNFSNFHHEFKDIIIQQTEKKNQTSAKQLASIWGTLNLQLQCSELGFTRTNSPARNQLNFLSQEEN